jgi:phosphate starvation-inducible PhoH-like protein
VAGLQTERVFEIAGLTDPLRFCGHLDRNLSALEAIVPVVVRLDGDRIYVSGDAAAVDSAHAILGRMYDAALQGTQVTPEDVALAARESRVGSQDAPRALPRTVVATHRGREIRPRTEGQRAFVEAMERCPLTFAIGPAGTGKTFLAIAMAVRALRAREISKIVLMRPAVEAGEKLGFLPGDVKEKVDPYLRPLYDALEELLDDSVVARALERGTIEVAPLAYMRGRTLSDAFIILDEAQNATHEQLKMSVTRLGRNAKMVVTGDVTQIDLPPSVRPGLLEAPEIFAGIDEIAIIELGEADVVRNPLVAKIVAAYARRR